MSILALVLFAVLPVIPVIRATPTTFVVDDDGQASPTDCDATDSAYTSIQAAIAAASAGDEIIVCPGTYNEQLNINKDGLTVRSFDGSAIDGSPDTVIAPNELVPAAVIISGSGNKFIGFYIVDTTTVGHPHAHRGIFVQGDYNIVEKNFVEGRGAVAYADVGILVRGAGVGDGVAENNEILHNIVTNIYTGIATVSVASNNAARGTIIQYNYVHGVFDVGITADRTPNTNVMFNEVVNNKIGVKFNSQSDLSGSGTIVKCNNIYGNTVYDVENIATDGSIMLAEFNWWGSPGGPDPAKIYGAVDYDPWLITPWEEAEECVLPPVTVGRMTGGGFILSDMNVRKNGQLLPVRVRLNFGFELHCDASKTPNNLQINWRPVSGGPSYIFHLENMETAACFETAADQEMPPAPFDTHIGSGTGRLKIGSSPWMPASVSWMFVDAGEPGIDTDELLIVIVAGTTIYTISGKISGGNIQAHAEDP